MQLKEVTITYGGKLNLGDYNSAHIELTVTALVDEGEQLDEVAGQLFSQVKAEVRAQVKELVNKRGAKVDEVFAGLPADVRSQMGGK